MSTRRPPDILRKSHAHSEGKTRARDKRELHAALEESTDYAGLPALLIDLDGVVYRGEEAITGSAETIRWLESEQVPYLFVTNTTSRPRETLVGKLAEFGIDVAADRILAPADAAATWLGQRKARRLLLAVTEITATAFADFETITLDQSAGAKVDAVVVGDLGRDWSFDRLNAAFRCLMQDPKPRLVALGMTRYWRAADGLRLDTAPFVVALAHASGIEPDVLGKPSAEFFAMALDRLGVASRVAWMIGDDIRADVGGAQAAGLRAMLVKTGKYRPGDLDLGIEPDLVLDSFAGLPAVWSKVVPS